MACQACGDPKISHPYQCSLCNVRTGNYSWCVITTVPEFPSEGNLHDSLVLTHPVWPTVPLSEYKQGWAKLEVFTIGEIFMVDKDFEREIFTPGRKPSKWNVQYELFPPNDLDKAATLALQLDG